jgi:hypothetical protein
VDTDPSDNTATLTLNIPLPGANPIAPTGTIPNANPTFVWSDVPGATRYQLWVSTATGTTLINTLYDDAGNCDGTDCEVTPILNLTSGTYSWSVRPWSAAAGYGAWSSETLFAFSPPGDVQTSGQAAAPAAGGQTEGSVSEGGG